MCEGSKLLLSCRSLKLRPSVFDFENQAFRDLFCINYTDGAVKRLFFGLNPGFNTKGNGNTLTVSDTALQG